MANEEILLLNLSSESKEFFHKDKENRKHKTFKRNCISKSLQDIIRSETEQSY